MVNSGSFDADGRGDRNAKAECTQPHNSASSDSTQTSSPVTTSDVSSCNSGFSRTADSDLPAIGPTPTKTEINCAMPIENNSNDFYAKERFDDEKSRISTSSADEKTSLCCSLPLDKVQGVLTPFHQFRSDDDAAVKAKPTRKLLCLYCERSFVSANLRQKHVERVHSVKQNRRVSSRRQNQLTVTPCVYCDKLNSTDNTLKDLFYHLVNEHSTKYFGCLPCEDRFLSSSLLADHNTTNHQETVSSQTSTPVSSITSFSKTSSPDEEEETIESADSQDEEITVKVTRSQVKPKIDDDGKVEPKKKVVKLKELRNKKLSIKSSRIALKRRESKRLQAIAKLTECQKKKRTKPSERKVTAVLVKPEQTNSTKSTEKVKTTPCVNPYPEFDCFYRVKKITDHSIDNLKISSLTFDDVFDKAFFNRIKCNIEENLLHHIDGKLFKNEESESRISNFEKISNISQETQNSSSENYGCEISLNAVTPVASLSLNSQYGEDFESQIEYGSKPSKKKTQTKTDEVHYKYFTRRKFQASILEHKENRDLSKLDMWTQLVIKKRQQKMLDEKKTAKEMLEYTTGDEYKSKIKKEELNRILDRRGPFEDLREEASKKVALDKLNSASEDNISHESFTDVREVLNEILNRVFAATESSDNTEEVEIEKICSKKQDLREIPCYLSLRRTSSLPSEGEIDRSDKITLICSSQETENFELPTNQVRDKNELIELSGEWARCRMYICAACGAKLPNMKYLLEHKSIYHQNVWVQHYEFVGNQSELYRHLSIPALGKVGTVEESVPCKVWKRSDARLCTKCGKQCNSLGELHRHLLECGGDWTWMLARKKCKYRPYGAKSRRKRRGLVHRVHLKQKTEPTEKKKYKKTFQGPRQRPSDADTIQRMLANLPAKRSTRKLISLQEGIYRARKKTQINSQLKNSMNKKKVKCGKVIYKSSSIKENTEKTINTRVTTNLPKNNVVTRRTLRSISKVLSSRIIDTNTKLNVRRKLKAINERRKTRHSQNVIENNKNENEDVETTLPKSAPQKSSNHKENIEETSPPKRTSPRSSPKTMSKMTVKKLLTGKINIKSFFPIKKQKKSPNTEVQISEEEPPVENQDKVKIKKKSKDLEDSKTDQKVANENSKVEQKKIKNNTFSKLVKSLNINKKKNNKKSVQPLPLEKDKTLPKENDETVSNPESTAVTVIENVVKQTPEKANKPVEVNTRKRKLKNSFRNVVNKVKKSKIDNTSPPQPNIELEKDCDTRQINNKDAFLGKSKENDKLDPPEQPEKIVIPSTSDIKENTADISEAVPIVMKFNETNENPPVPETIFKLESNNEKNLQAKGELDFDTQPNIITDQVSETNEITNAMTKEDTESVITDVKEDVTVTVKLPEETNETMQPISIETSVKPKTVPLISPNMKGKIRKPARGLNDCIAMLTSKLQQKTNEKNPKIDGVLDLSPTSNAIKTVPDLSLSKPDCILKIPTFKMPHMELEETALDLSMKSKSNPDLTNQQKIENIFRSNCLFTRDLKWKAHSTSRIFNSVDQTIEDVIGNRILPIFPIKSQNIWSSVDETIQNVIDGHKKHFNIPRIADLPKNSVDDIIELVIASGRKINVHSEEKQSFEDKLISNLISAKLQEKSIPDKILNKTQEETEQKNENMSNASMVTNIEINAKNGNLENNVKLVKKESIKKRGRPKKIKPEPESTLPKTAITDNTIDRLQEVQNCLVDGESEKVNTETLAKETKLSKQYEKLLGNEVDNTIVQLSVSKSMVIESAVSTSSDSGTINDDKEDSVVNSESKEFKKVVTSKSKNKSTKKGKEKQKQSNRPFIETNVDSLLHFEEVKKPDVSILVSTDDGQNQKIKLLNEDEPHLLESKILVTENKSGTFLSDSEDDLPLATLVKSDEKSINEESMKNDKDFKEGKCKSDNELIDDPLADKNVVETKEQDVSLHTINETESEINETDNSKILHYIEKDENKPSTVTENLETVDNIDDKILNDTQNEAHNNVLDCDSSINNSILDQLPNDLNKDLAEHVDSSNGKLKTCKLIEKKQKSKKRKVIKKNRYKKLKQIVEANKMDEQALETSQTSDEPTSSSLEETPSIDTSTDDSSKPTENLKESSDHIFKTPLKRIKPSKKSKTIKRSKSLGDVSNDTFSNFENELEKSASLKDLSTSLFATMDATQEQTKENSFDAVITDNAKPNGSIEHNIQVNSEDINDYKETKINLRNVRKGKNSKKSEDSYNKIEDNILNTKFKVNGRNRKYCSNTDVEETSDASSSSLLDSVEESKVFSSSNIISNTDQQTKNKNSRNSVPLTRSASVSDFSESSNSFLDTSSDLDYSANVSDRTDAETTDTSFSTKSTPKKPKKNYKKSKSRKLNHLKYNTKNKSVPVEIDQNLINVSVSTSLEEENTLQSITNDSDTSVNKDHQQTDDDIASSDKHETVDRIEPSFNKNVKVNSIKRRGRKPKYKKGKFVKKIHSTTLVAAIETLNQIDQVTSELSDSLNPKEAENETIDKRTENLSTEEIQSTNSGISNNECSLDDSKDVEELKQTKSRSRRRKSQKITNNTNSKHVEDQIEEIEPIKRVGSLRIRNKSNVESVDPSIDIVDSRNTSDDSCLSEIVDNNVTGFDSVTTEEVSSTYRSRSSRYNKSILLNAQKPSSGEISEIVPVITEEQSECPKEESLTEINPADKPNKKSNKKKKLSKQNSKAKQDNLDLITADIDCSIKSDDADIPAEIGKNSNVEIIPDIQSNESIIEVSPASIVNKTVKKGKKQKALKDSAKNIENPPEQIKENELEETKVITKRRSKSLQLSVDSKETESDTSVRRPRSARNKKINYVETYENDDDDEELEIAVKENECKEQQISRSGRRNANLIDESKNDDAISNETEEKIENKELNSSSLDNSEQLNNSKVMNEDMQSNRLEKCNKLSLELTIPLCTEATQFETNKGYNGKVKRHLGNKRSKTIGDLNKKCSSPVEIENNHNSGIIENSIINENNDNKETITNENEIVKNISEKPESENNHEPPIKLIINKQKTRRKSKSFRKIDLKGQNDLFKDFALVIKKPKRILPIITFCSNDNFMKDTYPNYLKKPDVSSFLPLTTVAEEKIQEASIEKEKSEVAEDLDASMEEMDMELDDEIPITSNIIERNDFSFANINDNIVNKEKQTINKIPKKTHKTKNKRIVKKKSKILEKRTHKNSKPLDKLNDDENVPDNLVPDLLEETDNVDKYPEIIKSVIVEDKLITNNAEQSNIEDVVLQSDLCDIGEIKVTENTLLETSSEIQEVIVDKSIESVVEPVIVPIKRKSKKGRNSKKKQNIDKNVPEPTENSFCDVVNNKDENVVSIEQSGTDKDENLICTLQVTNTKKSNKKDIDSIYAFTEFEDLEIEKPIEMPRFTRKQTNISEMKVDTSKQQESDEIEAEMLNEEEILNEASESSKVAGEPSEILKDTSKKRSSSKKGVSTLKDTIETKVLPLRIISKNICKSSKQIDFDTSNSSLETSEQNENEESFVDQSRRKSSLILEDNLDCLDTSEELNVDSRRKSKYSDSLDDSLLKISEENINGKDKTSNFIESRKKKLKKDLINLSTETIDTQCETTENPEISTESKLDKEITNENYDLKLIPQERITFKFPSRIKTKFNRDSNSETTSISLESSEDELQIKPITRKSRSSTEISLDSFDYETLKDDVCDESSSRPTLRRTSKSNKDNISDLDISDSSYSEIEGTKQSSKRKSKSKKSSVSNVPNAIEFNKKEAELMIKLYSESPIKFNTDVSLQNPTIDDVQTKRKSSRKNDFSDINLSKESCDESRLLDDFDIKDDSTKSTTSSDYVINKDQSTETVPEHSIDETSLKSTLRRKSKISETILDVDLESLELQEDKAPLKSKSKRKSKSSLDYSMTDNFKDFEMEQELPHSLTDSVGKDISGSLEAVTANTTEFIEEFPEKPVVRKKLKNKEAVLDIPNLVGTSFLTDSSLLTDETKPISKKKSKSRKNVNLGKDNLESNNLLDINAKQIDTVLTENPILNTQLNPETEACPNLTESIWTIEDENSDKPFSLKSIVKRKSKPSNEISLEIETPSQIIVKDVEISSNIVDTEEQNSEVLPTVKKKTKNKSSSKSTELCNDLKDEEKTVETEEVTVFNKNENTFPHISINTEVDQLEIEKTQEQMQKPALKKRSKFTREVTLEDIQENLSSGAIKENNLNIDDVGRRKSVRSAKVKALEHIHDEALAELTESERNRDLNKAPLDTAISESRKVSKKSKKSQKMSALIDNFEFRQKILEEEKSPLFADLVADLAGLEELENSIERELNAEMNEKEENYEILQNNDKTEYLEKKPEENNFTDFSIQDNQELRRSRRESRKVTSYNENDLIDPLLDIINNKKKNKRNDRTPSENKTTKKSNKELEKKLNSDELFDLLKASTNEQIFMPKLQNSFLDNLDDTSRDFNIDEHFDSVFDNAIEKSTLLVSNANAEKNEKIADKNYEFTDNSVYNEQKDSFHAEKKKTKKSKRNTSPLKASIEENLDSNSFNQDIPLPEESSKIDKNESNYCDICNKSFIRIENLIKHKRTLTHIQKLSELEAKEAEEKSKLEQITNELNNSESVCDISAEIPDTSKNSLESTTDINIHNILLESEQPGNHQVVHSAFSNNDALKLADLISDVLNKPVLQDDKEESNNFASAQSEIQPEYKRYKSLGERKSFDSDNILLPNDNHILPISEPYISKTTILEKQISLLENIIESQNRVNYIDDISMSSNNSTTEVLENSDIPKLDSVSKSNSKPLSDDSFLKPTQYEEISEDSINLRNYEDQKLRKTLNRDEELFLECCSLLKSGSEVSSYSNQRSQKISNSLDLKQYDEPESMEEKGISQNSNCELEDDYSDDNSRIPTPLGDSYDDDASDSNTISSNWDINNMAPVFEEEERNVGPSLTFQEVLNTTVQNSKYGCTSKRPSKLPKLDCEDKHEESKECNETSIADNKKIITKGARKVFEGLKVSIPTEELNLEEVLNCSPKVKADMLIKNVSDDHTVPDMKDSSPPKPSRTARKSKPVKKSQVGSALLFKMNKKKIVSPPINSPSKQADDELAKSYDVYDFEETQDNTDVFTKPDFKTFRTKKSLDNPDIESDSENRDDDLGSFSAEPESVTSSVSSTSSLKKSKAQENITKKKCMIMGRIFKSQARCKIDDIDEEMREIPIIDNDELVESYVANCKKIIKNEMKPKLSEKEINQLFDQLLENKNTEKKSANSTLTKTTTKSKQEPKKVVDNKKKKLKTKKRARTNSDSTDDEFSLNKTSRRSNKKSCKAEDNCINLEQELKECIGVASRKSQRKCTSGKQNVLVEYWSSDDSQFEALLESQKIEVKPKQTEELQEIETPQPPPKTLEEEIEAKLNEKSTAPSEILNKPKKQEKRILHRKKSTSEKKEKTQHVENEKTDTMSTNRRKRAAANPLYHWSSSSEDESQDLIEVKPLRDEEEDEEDRPIQHGWIVGDSPKKLVTMLAQAKGKKTDIDCVKEQGKKRTNTVS